MKKALATAATAALLGLGAFVLSAGSASAYIVCNSDGDCWHSNTRYHAPGVRFEYHPDNWYFDRDWTNDRDHHWHEHHEGRGYWRNGIWITL
jgi:hypothetical protein